MEREIASARYTVYEDPLTNQEIGRQVLQISNRVLAEVNDVVALFLLGGFARGEGSVIRESGEVTPLGDYDFFLISRFPHRRLNLPWLDELQQRFHVQYHIGVDSLPGCLLPLMPRRIFWYEFKFGSKLLFGDKRVLDKIPIGSAADIDVTDSFSLMSNRLEGLVRSFDPDYQHSTLARDQARHLVFQSVKAILACGESLLLMSGKYDFSYEERGRKFARCFKTDCADFFSQDPELQEDYAKATQFKLKPEFSAYPDPVEVWFTAKSHVLKTLRYYASTRSISRRAGRRFEFEFPEALLSESHPELLDYLLFNYNSIRRKSLKGLKWFRSSFADIVRVTLIHLALSVEKSGEIQPDALSKALNSLRLIYPLNAESLQGIDSTRGWLLVRNAALTAYAISRH